MGDYITDDEFDDSDYHYSRYVEEQEMAERQTGIVRELLEIVRNNAAQATPPIQHVLIHGPTGSGKTTILHVLASILMRMDDSAGMVCHFASDLALKSAAPETILQWATAATQLKPSDGTFPWRGGDEAAWEAAIAGLYSALDQRFGPGRGLAVIMLDNFDAVLSRVFGSRDVESRLRRLLQETGRIMIIGATRDRGLQSDYDRPLFQIFHSIEVPSFDFLSAMETRFEVTEPLLQANLFALGAIVGFEYPRRLNLALHLAKNNSSPRDVFLRLRNIEEPSFQQTVENLAIRPARLLDALLTGGEPARPATLADRLGTQQSDIAPVLRDLLSSGLIRKGPNSGGKQTFYELSDRLLADWYVSRRKYRESVAAYSVDVVAIDMAWKTKVPMSDAFTASMEKFTTVLRSEKRSMAFHAFMADFNWRRHTPKDPKPGTAQAAALIVLITEPVSPALLWDIATTLRERHLLQACASLVEAAALVPLDKQQHEMLASRSRINKGLAAHPDARRAVEVIRANSAQRTNNFPSV